MQEIYLKGISWKETATEAQRVTVKYRDLALPDAPENYVTVATNVLVTVTGDINPDLLIGNLPDGNYALYVINECSNRGVRKDFTIPMDTTYIWVEDAYVCEQEGVFTETSQVTGLSSPAILMYDATSSRVYGIDLDRVNGTFFSYNPASFTSNSDITYYPAVLKSGASSYMFGGTAHAPSRRLFACGRDSDGVQVFNIATGITEVVVWGLNHTVAPSGSGNGYPRASLKVLGDSVIGVDKYSNTMIILDANTLASSTINITGIPSYQQCFIGAPIIDRVGNEYWVLNNQGNNTEDPNKSPNIFRYNLTFTSLIGTIDISAYSAVWSFGAHQRATYVDTTNNRYYMFDAGASTLVVIDTTDNTIDFTREFNIKQGKSNASFSFVVDPITNDLFLSGSYANGTTDSTMISTAYRISRTDYSITNVYANTGFGNLAQIGSTSELHGANAGNPGWTGNSGWGSDGKITKFSK